MIVEDITGENVVFLKEDKNEYIKKINENELIAIECEYEKGKIKANNFFKSDLKIKDLD